jgi:hypothetical protein
MESGSFRITGIGLSPGFAERPEEAAGRRGFNTPVWGYVERLYRGEKA